MHKIKSSELVAGVILDFCENLAELGCPRNEKDPDMWYRYLSPKQQIEVGQKLIKIIDRDAKRFKKETKKTKEKK